MIPAVIQPNHVAVHAISTPGDEENHMSQMTELEHPTKPGEKIYKVNQVGLACKSCQKKGKKCTHNSKHIPNHISGERRLIAQAMLDRDELTKTQEMLGIIASSTLNCFTEQWISAFFEAETWLFSRPVKVLHASIDPHAGGNGSETAITALALEGMNKVYVGADAEGSSKKQDIVDMIVGFFYMLGTVDAYKNSVCFVSIESNHSWHLANELKEILEKMGGNIKIMFVNRDPTKQERDGCWLSDTLKEVMTNCFAADLSNGLIKFAREFVSRDPEVTKKKIKEQMRRFRRFLKPSVVNGTAGNTLNRGTTLYKYDGKVNGQPDDLVLVMMMSREYAIQLCASENYQYLARLNGWR